MCQTNHIIALQTPFVTLEIDIWLKGEPIGEDGFIESVT